MRIVYIVSGALIASLMTTIILRKRKQRRVLRKKILTDSPPDYSKTAQNIADSISKSREVYKQLIQQVHPDRVSEEYRLKATELSSRITKAKRNYNELIILKEEVDTFLSGQK